MVYQVAAHLLGRHQRTIQLHVVTVGIGGLHGRQHLHLDVTGNAQLVADVLLSQVRLLQPAEVPHHQKEYQTQ